MSDSLLISGASPVEVSAYAGKEEASITRTSNAESNRFIEEWVKMFLFI
jgi:hypothetical protein